MAVTYNQIHADIVELLGTGTGDVGYGQTIESTAFQTGDLITVDRIEEYHDDIQKMAIHQLGRPSTRIVPPTGINTIAQSISEYFRKPDQKIPDTQGRLKSIDRYAEVVADLRSARNRVAENQLTTETFSTVERVNPWRWIDQYTGISCEFQIVFQDAEWRRLFENTGGSIEIEISTSGGSTTKWSALNTIIEDGEYSFSSRSDNWTSTYINELNTSSVVNLKTIVDASVDNTTTNTIRVDLEDLSSDDIIIDGSTVVVLSVKYSEFFKNILDQMAISDVITVNITQDFDFYPVPPTYSLSAPSEVEEGNSFTVTLETENVDNGEFVPFTITDFNMDDISNMEIDGTPVAVSSTGSFQVSNGASTLTLETVFDARDRDRKITVSLDSGKSRSVTTVKNKILTLNEGIWCLSVLDEDTSGRNGLYSEYISFRNSYPFRELYVIQIPLNFGTYYDVFYPPGWDTVERNHGPIFASRDNGELSQASDWYSLCDLDRVPSNYAVHLSVDNSGSTRTDSVSSSIDLLYYRLKQRNIKLMVTRMPSENFVKGHVRDFSLSIPNLEWAISSSREQQVEDYVNSRT